MPHVVFLNGPPKCGKDMLVSQLVEYIKFNHLKAAAPLKRAAGAVLDMDMKGIEEYKDVTSRLLKRESDGSVDTVRQFLISMSEDWMKVRYGKAIFGKLLGRDIRNSAASLSIVSDCGFADELEACLTFSVGTRNAILVRIHREGCDFTNDSRSYLHPSNVACYDIDNNGTKYEATMKLLRIIQRSFNPPLLKEPAWVR